eukprot:TRINITY_DN24408_c0_g1_i1.p1 TRINITY_DN24408_c0_g1~~TRINITY_DN24408_c0_g1_i1.p1  ORF type:complete len:156 (+),score=15.30 TRINITY_DN24408_c0_g1_i1:37-504(+)
MCGYRLGDNDNEIEGGGSAFASVHRTSDGLVVEVPVYQKEEVLVFSPSFSDRSGYSDNEACPQQLIDGMEEDGEDDFKNVFYSISTSGKALTEPFPSRSVSRASVGSVGNVLAYAAMCTKDDRWKAEYAEVISKTLQQTGRGYLTRLRMASLESC